MNKESLLSKIVSAIIFPFAIFGVIGLGLKAYQKVSTGHGLETYITGWGIQTNYITALIVFILIPIVLIVGWLINYFITRDERHIKKEIERQKRQKHYENKC